MIETWTLQGVDVIAVSPNDPDIVAPAMKKAREKGVHVITWDSDGQAAAREFFVNQATAKDIGYALVDTLAKDIAAASKISDSRQAAGQVAIITATLTAANQNAWIKYITERLPEYPKLQLIATKPCDDKQNVAFQVAQDLTKAYPDLKGIFAISSVAFPGAADAIKQSGKSGQIQITGLGTPDGMRSSSRTARSNPSFSGTPLISAISPSKSPARSAMEQSNPVPRPSTPVSSA